MTQVVSANNAYVFHNRLTHSLQVAQVGRRIAEFLVRRQLDVARQIEGVDPDAVEAASLAHDLGHPPFGHVAETELNLLAGSEIGGFEGNAQSFRIVTSLAFKSPNHDGLDLTRATLAAILKYPWLHGQNKDVPNKWGAYQSEEEDFGFAREIMSGEKLQRTAEAEIMDWADDVTYSVHDIEDFYRAGRIPLHLLGSRPYEKERKLFFDNVFERRKGDGEIWKQCSRSDLEQAFIQIVAGSFPIEEPYSGTKSQRSELRAFTSSLIERYVNGIGLRHPTDTNRSRIVINPELQKEIAMLKELTWTYVIEAPSLAAHQHGQRSVIRDLFHELYDAAQKPDKLNILPVMYQERVKSASAADIKRAVIDLIAGMTEQQAIAMHQRLRGIAPGSGLEEILK